LVIPRWNDDHNDSAATAPRTEDSSRAVQHNFGAIATERPVTGPKPEVAVNNYSQTIETLPLDRD